MEPRITQRDNFTVIGLKCRTTLQNNVIPKLWDDFGKRMEEIKNASGNRACFGICFYEAGDAPGGQYFSYLASLEVTDASQLPEGMVAREIPAAEYAVFEHRGSLETLQQTYRFIYSDWLVNSGYKMVGSQDFELYDQRFKFGQPDSVMEIWIPIARK